MAEFRDRPTEVRTVAVNVPIDGEAKRELTGVLIDDVLRQVLWDIRTANGWKSTAETARRLGIPQQTLTAFFDREILGGMRLETLSRVCAALRTSPVDLLRRHEKYRPENKEDAPFAEDLIFDRFRSILTPATARRLVRILETMIDRGALASTLDSWERGLDTSARSDPQTKGTKARRSR